MGVLSCSRKYCTNIMCDIYVPQVGYICYECKREFINFAESYNQTFNTTNDVVIALNQFLNVPKGSSYVVDKYNKIDLEDFFNTFSY